MNINNSLFTTTDMETRRKQVLANIYSLLLRLAEEKQAVVDSSSPYEENDETSTTLEELQS